MKVTLPYHIVTAALLAPSLLASAEEAAASSSFLRNNGGGAAALAAADFVESACNGASDKDQCYGIIDEVSNKPCEWCVAGAIPSECMSPGQASQLPPAVFQCSSPGMVEDTEDVLSSGAGRLYSLKNVKEHEGSDLCDASSKSISGYMDIKNSKYDQDDEDKHLFFWMFEKRGSSDELADDEGDDSTPFILWLTGGPGCSSTLALLTENGPCHVNEDGESTSVNPYSWTESAHVMWLDQPAGVGFSYGSETDTNEEMISEDAYWFLQAFFQKYSQYSKNPLYVVGESYGGHYAPAIAHRVYRGNQKLIPDKSIHLNLSGLGIGNGLTNPEEQYKWYAMYFCIAFSYRERGFGVSFIRCARLFRGVTRRNLDSRT